MITRYLPEFRQLEPDNLLGLTAGLVVAQAPVKYTAAVVSPEAKPEAYGVRTVEKTGYKFIENGVLCTFDAKGEIVDWTANKPLFIHFTEELNTFLGDRKYFAVECEKDETYLRLVMVVPGSEWTTNVAEASGDAYAAVIAAGKIVCINDKATLPNGDPAKTYRCIA